MYIYIYHGSRTESESFRRRVGLSEGKLEWEPGPMGTRFLFLSHVGGELISFFCFFVTWTLHEQIMKLALQAIDTGRLSQWVLGVPGAAQDTLL